MSFFRRVRNIADAKRAKKSGSDSLFSISSAYISLDVKLGLKSTGKAAVAVKSADGTYFYELQQELKTFLDSIRPEFDINYKMTTDSYGYMWVILDGQKVEDLVAGANSVSDTIVEKGFGKELLAAAFEFRSDRAAGAAQYLVFTYKRNKFYPFVPTGKDKRDTEAEMKIMATIGDEVPFEKDIGLWYPLWDIPIKSQG